MADAPKAGVRIAPTKLIYFRLREIRDKIGCSQTQFANALNIRRNKLCTYETGRFLPSLEFVMFLKERLGLSTLDEMFLLVDEKEMRAIRKKNKLMKSRKHEPFTIPMPVAATELVAK